MSAQMDMFVATTAPYRRWRKSDPETSRIAATRNEKGIGSQAKVVLDAIQRWPGSTACELAMNLSKIGVGTDYSAMRFRVSRRTADLAKEALVRRGKPRVCTVAGSPQTTWFPA